MQTKPYISQDSCIVCQATDISSVFYMCAMAHLELPVSLQDAVWANKENGFWMRSSLSQANAAHEQHRHTAGHMGRTHAISMSTRAPIWKLAKLLTAFKECISRPVTKMRGKKMGILFQKCFQNHLSKFGHLKLNAPFNLWQVIHFPLLPSWWPLLTEAKV